MGTDWKVEPGLVNREKCGAMIMPDGMRLVLGKVCGYGHNAAGDLWVGLVGLDRDLIWDDPDGRILAALDAYFGTVRVGTEGD